MNILFVTENFPPETNAAATRVFERALYWVKGGHKVTVITQAPNFPEGRLFKGYHNYWREVEDIDGIRVVRVMTFISANRGVVRRALDFLSFGVTATLAGIGEAKPDVVAATSPQFFAAVAGWLIGKLKRVPFVFELGDLWPLSISAVGAMKKGRALALMEKLELRLYRDSAAVAALTHAFKRNLVSRGIDEAKIHVVLNGVDLPRYAPRPREEILAAEWGLTGRFVVGYVGTLGMAHGLANVLAAAERLAGDTRIRFLFVGAGAERQMLVDMADEKALPNVVFAAPQPKEEMPTVWSLCDVALVHLKDSPAFAEVIPSKIFEAWAMGLPVLLAAPQGEASALVERHRAGVAVPPGDPEALADAVRALAADPEARTRYASAGGFVGRAVVRALRTEAHTLSGTTRSPVQGQGPDGIPLYRIADFAEDADWSRIVAGADVIVHLAARAHHAREGGMAELALYRAVNRDGSRRLAEAAAAAGVKRFVFMSSVKAIGEESQAPLTEDIPPKPEDAYGLSKWEAEQALAEVAARTGLELVVLRPPLVYGPHARGNLLTLMQAIDRGWPLPLAGIVNRRSLISAANLASAVALTASHPYAAGSTFHVADGEDVSTPELVQRLARALGRPARLVRVPGALMRGAQRTPWIGDKVRRLASSLQLDSRLIRDRLAWRPAQTLDDGLAEMAAAFRSRSG